MMNLVRGTLLRPLVYTAPIRGGPPCHNRSDTPWFRPPFSQRCSSPPVAAAEAQVPGAQTAARGRAAATTLGVARGAGRRAGRARGAARGVGAAAARGGARVAVGGAGRAREAARVVAPAAARESVRAAAATARAAPAARAAAR